MIERRDEQDITPRSRRAWVRGALLAVGGGAASAALALHTGCVGWSRREFDALAPRPRATHRAAGNVSVVTLNTWRLREVSRVPRLYETLEQLGDDLAPADAGACAEGARLPDVIALQELEGQSAIDALAERLERSHAFVTCVCARNDDGTNRSVVGLAVRRARFAVVSTRRIELGRLWPDHTRCALSLRVAPREQGAAALDLTVVHLSSRPWNAAQAARLGEALRAGGSLALPASLVTGDFNFTPGSAGYRHLARAPLRDPFPLERGRTHWVGGRLDHVFTGPGLALVRPLDRALAFRAVRPASRLEPSAACRRGEDPRDASAPCPVSDHLPEGGVFRYASR